VRYLSQLLFVLGIALLTGCNTIGQDARGVENFAQVSPDLYRGAQPTPEGIKMLAARNIKTVVNLRDRDEVDPNEAELVRQTGMQYFTLHLDARKATHQDAHAFLAILEKAPKPIFVHCHAGRDRTGLVVAAYRILLQQWTTEAAEKELYSYGHYWALFPRISRLVTTMTDATPASALARATARAGEKVDAATEAPARN
jgi:uncharacterized protein (TIGR01244 family)